MKNFLLASRPKTLLASIIPPLMSFIYTTKIGFDVSLILVVCCVLSALCIQLATNFFNDLIDNQKGADNVRHGPLRVTSAGLVAPTTIKYWSYSSLIFAALFAIPLIQKAGFIILIPGLLSLYLSYGYTGGPYPLAYKGLGETFVFLFFGVFSVVGSFYIYTSQFSFPVLLLSFIYGFLTMTLICVNNLRDRIEDQKVNKLTLATKVSEKTYIIFTLCSIFLPYLFIFEFTSLIKSWPMIISFFLALKLSKIILTEKLEKLNLGLKFGGLHLILFSLSFSIIIFYENLFPSF
jgi:1,4-dihydroxy-2-naphthoate octaprenyltransferase